MPSEQLHSEHIRAPPAGNTLHRPFDKFPPEISSQILSLAWLSCRGDDSEDRFNFPSILSKVDRYFNHIAISTPILWTYLRVTSVTQLAHMQQRIQFRSGALPLDLYLIFEGVVYEEAALLVKEIIVQSSSRFRKITLSYCSPSILRITSGRGFWDHLSALNNCPLHTTHFSIDADSYSSPLSFLPPFTPSIRILDLSCSQFYWSGEFFPDSLEVLSIEESGHDAVGVAQISQFLGASHLRSLCSLTLSQIFIDDEEDAPAEPCILNSLEHFCLHGFCFWEAVMIFGYVLTPNLQHLSMTVVATNPPDPPPATWGPIQFPRLHTLTLQNFYTDTSNLFGFIDQLLESVKRLEIIADGPLAALQVPSTVSFCGQLHQIVAKEVSFKHLVSLVGGRYAALQELQVRYRTIAQAQESLSQEEFMRCLDALKRSRVEATVLVGGDPDTPTRLTLEQLAPPFETNQS